MLINIKSITLLIILISFLVSYEVNSQSIDSLKTTLNFSKDKIKNIKTQLSLAEEFLSINSDSSLYYLNNAIELMSSEQELADAYFIKGYIYFLREEFDKAVKYYFGAISLYKKSQNTTRVEALLKSVMDIADMHDLTQLAIHYGEQRIDLLGTEFGYKKEAEIYYSLGLVYSHSSNFFLANKYMFIAKKVLDENADSSDYEMYADLFNNIGIVQFGLSHTLDQNIYLDSALYFYKRSLHFDDTEWNKSKVINNIANIHIKKSEWQEADSLLQIALSIQGAIGAERLSIATNFNLGVIAFENEQYERAKQYFNISITLNVSKKQLEDNIRDNDQKVIFQQENELTKGLMYLDSIQLHMPEKVSQNDERLKEHYTHNIEMARRLKVSIGNTIQKESFIAIKKASEIEAQQARKEKVILWFSIFLLSAFCLFLLFILYLQKRKSKSVRNYLQRKYGRS